MGHKRKEGGIRDRLKEFEIGLVEARTERSKGRANGLGKGFVIGGKKKGCAKSLK